MSIVFDQLTVNAIERCLRDSISFALISLPEEDVFRSYASSQIHTTDSIGQISPNSFIISPFGLCDKLTYYYIPQSLSPELILRLDSHDIKNNGHFHPWPNVAPSSTPQNTYINIVTRVISQLDDNTEKVVISRIKHHLSTTKPLTVAQRYFNDNSNCFRYLYFIPHIGLWLGASPELLIDYSPQNETLYTMSLAGTRVLNSNQNWDDKNIEEHEIVTKHIVETLSAKLLSAPQIERINVPFGDIEHLCDKMMWNGTADLDDVLSELSPTPALLGFPRQKAYDIINALETHSRQCYGGFIGIKEALHTSLYVNLRCAKISNKDDSFLYECFGGGGITLKSNPLEEWLETEKKLSPLLNAIKQ